MVLVQVHDFLILIVASSSSQISAFLSQHGLLSYPSDEEVDDVSDLAYALNGGGGGRWWNFYICRQKLNSPGDNFEDVRCSFI